MDRLYTINRLLTLFCLLGLGLSIYLYVVEMQHKADKYYKAFCDINEAVKCTRIMSSKYGKGFGGILTQLFGENSLLDKPNSLFAILSYSLLATLSLSNSEIITKLSMFIIVLSNLMSGYLAYAMFVILQDLCVVCLSLYVVNFANLIFVYLKVKELGQKQSTEVNRKQKIK